jgi:hypothetical protein
MIAWLNCVCHHDFVCYLPRFVCFIFSRCFIMFETQSPDAEALDWSAVVAEVQSSLAAAPPGLVDAKIDTLNQTFEKERYDHIAPQKPL